MKYLINTTYLSDSQKRMENVELSSSCPCCGVSLFPDLLYAVCVDHDDTEEDIVYTFNHCQNCIMFYFQTPIRRRKRRWFYLRIKFSRQIL